MMRKEAYRGVAMILGEPYQTGYLPLVDQAGAPAGILFVGVGKLSELADATVTLAWEMVATSLVVLLLAIGLILILSKRLLKPIVEVANVTTAMAGGEDNIAVSHGNRSDEIGAIARAVAAFGESVSARRKLEAEQIAEARRVAERKIEMDEMVQAFRGAIATNFSRLRSGAEQVRSTSENIRAVVEMANDRVRSGSEAADFRRRCHCRGRDCHEPVRWFDCRDRHPLQ